MQQTVWLHYDELMMDHDLIESPNLNMIIILKRFGSI